MQKYLLTFTFSSIFFSFLIPLDRFLDPDAFYHAKISLLLWHNGALKAFPWLDLTTLGQSFADHHWLFHVIEAPFVAWLDWAAGARLTAIILTALFAATFYGCLRWLGLRRSWLWTLVLLLNGPLLTRLLLAKATPLALTWFILGLTAVWKRKPCLAFLSAMLFALSHGGWVYLLGAGFFLTLGEAVHNQVLPPAVYVSKRRLTSLRDVSWREVGALIAGAAFGTFIHPNFPENLSFLWIQVVKIGLGTPFQHVILGREWLPAEITNVIGSFAAPIILLIFGLGGLCLAPRHEAGPPSAPTRNVMRAITSFGWPVAAFFALTLKSQRNAEYFAPLLVLWLAWIWSMVDVRKLLWEFISHRETPKASWRSFFLPVFATILIYVFLQPPFRAFYSFRDGGYPDASYQVSMRAISERAEPGDRVFHSDWDEFPILFNLDDRLRYIAGLDPTFLHEASSTLSDAYRDLTWGQTTTTKEQAWDLIHDRTQSRFVFIAKEDHQKLLELIKSDERYKLLADTPDSAAFELTP